MSLRTRVVMSRGPRSPRSSIASATRKPATSRTAVKWRNARVASSSMASSRPQAVDDQVERVREIRWRVDLVRTHAGQERVLQERPHDQRCDQRPDGVVDVDAPELTALDATLEGAS